MKILLAKPGLDGHDVGVKVLAHGLIEAGFTVKYTGLRKSIDDIVARAIAEKPDYIGLSILSGSHLILCEKFAKEMKKNKLTIPWVVGGNIPVDDVEKLVELGAKEAFPTGTAIKTVINFLNKNKL